MNYSSNFFLRFILACLASGFGFTILLRAAEGTDPYWLVYVGFFIVIVANQAIGRAMEREKK